MTIRKYLITLAVAVMAVFIIPQTNVKAADDIQIVEVNYRNSSITLKAGSGDTVLFVSDAKQKTWEEVPGQLNPDKTIEMDISWISSSKNYVLSFKGDVTKKVTTVTLPKTYTKFKASYKKATGKVVFTNTDSRAVEWRKKDSLVWTTVNESTLDRELETLFTRGATIYFRLAPVNGDANNAGKRPGKEVSVSIPKKLSAPEITIDNAKLAIMLKNGMAYRTVKSDGTAGEWNNIIKSEYVPLTKLAPESMYNPLKEGVETVLQFRTNATTSKQVSAITTVTVPVQKQLPDIDDSGITLTYTGSTTLNLQIKAASAASPYEYTIVEKDETLDMIKAVWNTIASQEVVKLTDKKAEQGSKIYIRKKSTGTQGSDKYELASVEYNITGDAGVSYPTEAKAEGLTKLISTAGVCNKENSDGNLTFLLYSPTKTTVADIKVHDTYSETVLGGVEFKSTVSENSDKEAPADKRYIITTRIISTEEIDSQTEKELLTNITLENGDKVESTLSTGVLIYLHEASEVNNPLNNKEYKSSFDRLYMSEDKDDDTSFKFRIDFGEQFIINRTTNSPTETPVQLSKLKYDGYVLTEDDYSVEYSSEQNSNGEVIAYATVSVDVSKFEKANGVTVHDEYEPLIIYLTNGEILRDEINIKLVSTATLKDAPLAFAMTAGSLKETETTTTTTSDGKEISKTEDIISIILELELFSKNYSIAINDVTWNGVSVYDSAQVSNGTAVVFLSNKKLNKLTSTSTSTHNLNITFSNGFVIDSGCKLTVLKPAD